MKRFEDIGILLNEAEKQLQEISDLYQESLGNKKINPRIGVLVKNFFENVRSPLDYLAKEICEKVLNFSGVTGFPISSETKEGFENFINNKLPDLKNRHSELYDELEKAQKYNRSGLHFLPLLAKLVNENKHDQLTPQKKIEQKTLEISFPGGASVKMGHGCSISGGGTISSGGAWFSPAVSTISPDSPVVVGQGIQQQIFKWVSFQFQTIDREVKEVLRGSLNEVKLVIARIKPHLNTKT